MDILYKLQPTVIGFIMEELQQLVRMGDFKKPIQMLFC